MINKGLKVGLLQRKLNNLILWKFEFDFIMIYRLYVVCYLCKIFYIDQRENRVMLFLYSYE